MHKYILLSAARINSNAVYDLMSNFILAQEDVLFEWPKSFFLVPDWLSNIIRDISLEMVAS